MEPERGDNRSFDEPRPRGVNVIVPVYGAAAELAACIASVQRHTALPPHRLLVIVDGPQAAAVEEVLGAVDPATSTILRNQKRQGFVASVNRGMRHSTGDVVLLNSDTVVSAGWLENLRAAGASSPAVATATPLSNNATICSFPEFLVENELPVDCDIEGVARAVFDSSERRYPELPTGVGVCLYVRRQALDELGFFDEQAFGLGYGEENDFCRRAVARGWTHVLDDATFVFHHGRRSFGARGARREACAERLLRRRHPDYYSSLVRFISIDPLAEIRRRATAALPTSPPPRRSVRRRVVHLVHGWPPFNHAGTEVYARQLALAQAEHDHVAAFVRVADPNRPTGHCRALFDHGVHLRLVVNNFDRRNPLARNALVDRAMNAEFASFLELHRPDVVHVHHLSGHAASLMHVAAARGVRIVYQAQDWWPICARANLVDSRHRPCAGPSAGRCSSCLPLTGLPPAPILNRFLYALRQRILRNQLARAHTYVMGSHAIRRDLEAHAMLAPGVAVHVLSYGVDTERLSPRDASLHRAELPLRCGYIGSMMPHKGVHVIVEAINQLEASTVELQLWGDPRQSPRYTAELEQLADARSVRFRGRFEEKDKLEVLHDMDLLLIPSIGMESFGIVAREAMAAGVPVLASRLGALAELAIDDRCGALLPAGDVAAWAAAIRSLVDHPETLNRWRQQLPTMKSIADHVTEVDAVYARVLAR